MSSDIAIKVENLSKCYQIFQQPKDRLKQFILPRIRRIFGMPQSQYYKEFWALRDVSFEVKKGETIGVVGKNGSGKSTLLQMICGTLNATSGNVWVNGRIAALLELGAGFNPEFTGRENVYMNGAILGLSDNEIDVRYEDILAFADIGDFINHPVKIYSSGMYVRLAFAVAVHTDPTLLVVDEALAVGDEAFQRKCYARIEQLKDGGCTILYVSHSAHSVISLCDRAFLLADGELLLEDIPKKVIAVYQKLMSHPVHEQKDLVTVIKNGNTDFRGQIIDDTDKAVSYGDYDSGLKSVTRTEYNSNGALIKNIRIETPSGHTVNMLNVGKEYFFCYAMTFTRTCFRVRWGNMFRTLDGIELAGLQSHRLNECENIIDEGAVIHVRLPFRCRFAPGSYISNAGVTGIVNNEFGYLHRIEDALLFRVNPNENLSFSGFIDLVS